jgi:predicted DNA-binding transcriptional regulator AlpA
MAQRSISRIHEGDFLLQDANGAAYVGKSFIPTVLSRRFTSSAKTWDKKLISKRRVAQLFGVSMHTIDCWLHDGKLPEPKRTFPRQKWDSEELVVRTRLKVSLLRFGL